MRVDRSNPNHYSYNIAEICDREEDANKLVEYWDYECPDKNIMHYVEEMNTWDTAETNRYLNGM
jgi:hypothetical protein